MYQNDVVLMLGRNRKQLAMNFSVRCPLSQLGDLKRTDPVGQAYGVKEGKQTGLTDADVNHLVPVGPRPQFKRCERLKGIPKVIERTRHTAEHRTGAIVPHLDVRIDQFASGRNGDRGSREHGRTSSKRVTLLKQVAYMYATPEMRENRVI